MNNIIQALQTIKNMRNPQQYVMGELNKLASKNPMIGTVIQNGNYETVVRNICKQRGIDIDSLINIIH